jgi:hypothetical protein
MKATRYTRWLWRGSPVCQHERNICLPAISRLLKYPVYGA